MTQIKKPYVKIEYNDCSPEYDYTICPFSMVADQIQSTQTDFEDIDEEGFEKLKPEVKLSVIFLTEEEWQKEFDKWDK